MNISYLPKSLAITALSFFVLCTITIEPAFAGEKWEKVTTGQGIAVYKKDVAGRNLPVFKGVGEIKENIFDVLAVLYDVPRRVDWVHKCTVSRVLKEYNELDRLVYNRTEAPWPISDRDVVVRTKVIVDRQKMVVRVAFKTQKHASIPAADGAVRVPRLRGYYEIRALSKNRTQVTYEVDADPGGLLPAWLVKMASKDLPLKTIANLRKEVRKTRKQNTYPEFRARWRTPENENYPEDSTRADATKPTERPAADATAQP